MDRSKFENPMSDGRQEWTRGAIREAFAELDKHPEKYAATFYTLIPEKKWKGNKLVADLEEYANNLGGYMADRIEQFLEWAQRICNGESWEIICNNADMANWYRLIRTTNKGYLLIGGSRKCGDNCPACEIFDVVYFSDSTAEGTVPLVSIKKN